MKQNEADLLAKAIKFAVEAHGEQKRKYTNEPYVTHPLAVMKIVQEVPHTTEMLAAAVLHDVVEDTPVELSEIKHEFGPTVASYVEGLTDISRPEDGNRAVRKALDKDHLAKQSAEVQTIKYADIISNTQDIKVNDPSFAKVYVEEVKALLDVLDKGDKTLYAKAKEIVYSS